MILLLHMMLASFTQTTHVSVTKFVLPRTFFENVKKKFDVVDELESERESRE